MIIQHHHHTAKYDISMYDIQSNTSCYPFYPRADAADDDDAGQHQKTALSATDRSSAPIPHRTR